MLKNVQQRANELEALLKNPSTFDKGKIEKCVWKIHASLRTDSSLPEIAHPDIVGLVISLVEKYLSLPFISAGDQKAFEDLKARLSQYKEFLLKTGEILSLKQIYSILRDSDSLPTELKQLTIDLDTVKNTLERFTTISCLFLDIYTNEGYCYPLNSQVKKREDNTPGEIKFIGLRDTNDVEIEKKGGKIRASITSSKIQASAEKAVTAVLSYTDYLARKGGIPKAEIPRFESYDVSLSLHCERIVDGESAGLSVALATLGALLDLPPTSPIAATGIIQEFGEISIIEEVGGIKEKIEAALGKNIYKILIPKKNFQEIKDKDWFLQIKGVIDVIPIQYLHEAIHVVYKKTRVEKALQKCFIFDQETKKAWIKRFLSKKKPVVATYLSIIFAVFLLAISFYSYYRPILERSIIIPYENFFYKFPQDKIGVAVAGFDIYDPVTNEGILGNLINADSMRAEIEKLTGLKEIEARNFPIKFTTHQEAREWGRNKRACIIVWGHAQKGKEVIKPNVRITLVPEFLAERAGKQIPLTPFFFSIFERKPQMNIDIAKSVISLAKLEIEDTEHTVSRVVSWIAGFIFFTQGNLSSAEKILHHLRDETKDNVEKNRSSRSLGNIYLCQGRFNAAHQIFEEYVALDPKNPYGYYALGLTHLFTGRIKSAIEKFHKSVSLTSEKNELVANSYYALYFYCLSSGKFKEAIEILEEAISQYPNIAKLHMLLGDAYCRNGTVTEGIKEFQKVLDLYNTLRSVNIELAWAYYAMGKLDESKKVVKKIQDKEPYHIFQILILLGMISETEGKLERAEAYFKRIIELFPNEPRAYLELLDFYRWSGKNKEARKLYKKIIDLVPEIPKEGLLDFLNFDLYDRLVDIQLNLGLYDQAEKICKTILEFWSEDISANLKLGQAYYLKGNLRAAEPVFRNIVESKLTLSPYETVNNFQRLGDIYFRMGKMKSAGTYYQKALLLSKVEEKRKDIHYSLGLFHHSQGRYDLAINEYNLALSEPKIGLKERNYKNWVLNQISANAYLQIGVLYFVKEEKKKAIECWKQAIPLWNEVIFGFFEKEETEKIIEEAVEEAKEYMKESPAWEAAYYQNLAKLYLLKRNLKDAATLIEKSESVQSHAENFIILALINNELGKIEETSFYKPYVPYVPEANPFTENLLDLSWHY